MEKNKVIALSVGMLIIGLVIGSAVGGRGDRNGRFGMERGVRGDSAQYTQYGDSNRMMNGANGAGQAGTHMMSNGQMMGNGGSMNMADMMTSMSASLQGKTGDALDQAFLSEMIVHHQGAIDMANFVVNTSKHQELKDLAQGIISAQTKEIAQMKAWQKAWYSQQ